MSTKGMKYTKLNIETPVGEAVVHLGDIEVANGAIHHVSYYAEFDRPYPATSGTPGAMWRVRIHGHSDEPITRNLDGRWGNGPTWTGGKVDGDMPAQELSGSWRSQTRQKWGAVLKELDSGLPAIHDYLAAHPEIIEQHYQDNVVGVINAHVEQINEHNAQIRKWEERIDVLQEIREHERAPLNLDEVARGKYDRREEKTDS